MRKIKMLILGLTVAVAGVFGLSSASVYAVMCPAGSARAEADSTVACNIPEEETKTNVFESVKTVIDVILSITGIMAVIMIIIGGMNYITSQGDPQKTKRGRDTVLYGIIGLIIALMAYVLVHFVLESMANSNG